MFFYSIIGPGIDINSTTAMGTSLIRKCESEEGYRPGEVNAKLHQCSVDGQCAEQQNQADDHEGGAPRDPVAQNLT